MAQPLGQPTKTGVFWVAATCSLIITSQLFTISDTPGTHIASWVLIGCTVLLFIAVVVSYLRKAKDRDRPPD